MTCFVFVSRTVRLAEKNKERKRQPRKRRREGEGEGRRRRERKGRRRGRREKRKERQRPVVVPWRAIYRAPNFFPSFFIPASRTPDGPHRLSFAFCLRRESCRMRAFHLSSCLSSSFCIDRPPNVSSPPLVFFAWIPILSPASRAYIPGHSFVESFSLPLSWPLFVARGRSGVRAVLAQMEEAKFRTRRNYGVHKVVRLMKSQFSVLPFCHGSRRSGGTVEGTECVSPRRAQKSGCGGIYARYANAPIEQNC